jgi:hypothetical protein
MKREGGKKEIRAIQALIEKGYLEHQATVAKLGAHMGLGNQVNTQGPCRPQVLQL